MKLEVEVEVEMLLAWPWTRLRLFMLRGTKVGKVGVTRGKAFRQGSLSNAPKGIGPQLINMHAHPGQTSGICPRKLRYFSRRNPLKYTLR